MKKLTYEELKKFLDDFEPVVIAWKLMITPKGIVTDEDAIIAHCKTEGF